MRIRSVMMWVGLALLPSLAQAASTDPLIEGAKLCTRHLSRYEREYGIPTHLLSAIASTESGRFHEGLKIKVPWPWTVNVEGKGYFYDSKLEAIDAVKKFRARGAQSIDVGCMQVNLHHHARAFVSLDQAFEPESNIAYAASFLRALYEEDGNSWKKAAADYHSKTPSLGRQYVGQVYDSWYQIIDKLRSARMQAPQTTPAVSQPKDIQLADARPLPANRPVKVVKASVPKISRASEQRNKKQAVYRAPHMNSISVRKAPEENGIMIVRPTSIPDSRPSLAPPMTVAEQSPEPKVIHVDNTRVVESSTPVRTTVASGPRFIFND